MSIGNPIVDDELKRLLVRRSAWRWGLTLLLVGAYFGYALGSLYFPQIYTIAFPGTSIPIGVLAGFAIIALSVLTSLLYVRVVGRLKSTQTEPDDAD